MFDHHTMDVFRCRLPAGFCYAQGVDKFWVPTIAKSTLQQHQREMRAIRERTTTKTETGENLGFHGQWTQLAERIEPRGYAPLGRRTGREDWEGSYLQKKRHVWASKDRPRVRLLEHYGAAFLILQIFITERERYQACQGF